MVKEEERERTGSKFLTEAALGENGLIFLRDLVDSSIENCLRSVFNEGEAAGALTWSSTYSSRERVTAVVEKGRGASVMTPDSSTLMMGEAEETSADEGG